MFISSFFCSTLHLWFSPLLLHKAILVHLLLYSSGLQLGQFCPPVDIWQCQETYWLSSSRSCCWHLLGRGLEFSGHLYDTQNNPLQYQTIWSDLLTAPKLRDCCVVFYSSNITQFIYLFCCGWIFQKFIFKDLYNGGWCCGTVG